MNRPSRNDALSSVSAIRIADRSSGNYRVVDCEQRLTRVTILCRELTLKLPHRCFRIVDSRLEAVSYRDRCQTS